MNPTIKKLVDHVPTELDREADALKRQEKEELRIVPKKTYLWEVTVKVIPRKEGEEFERTAVVRSKNHAEALWLGKECVQQWYPHHSYAVMPKKAVKLEEGEKFTL